MSEIARLRSERASLERRIEAGKPGVTTLRARLQAVVHELMRLGG